MDTSSTINGDTTVANEKDIHQLESDLAQISLLDQDPSLLGGDDVAELLQRLSSAERVAQRVESRIDNVMQSLDELWVILGLKETPTTSEDAGSTSRDSVSADTKTSD